MLRVMRNHRRAAHGETQSAMKSSAIERRFRSIVASCPEPILVERAKRRLGRERSRLAKSSMAIAMRKSTVDRADRHDRSRDGLRHDRHRTRFCAREVQEARRWRLLSRSSTAPCRKRCARLVIRESQIAEIEAYAVGHGSIAQGTRRSTPFDACAPRAFTDEKIAAVEGGHAHLPSTSSSCSTNGRLGEDLSHGHTQCCSGR